DDLPLTFVSPQRNHDRSDSIGEDILGNQPSQLYTDDAASAINSFRMKVMMKKGDIVLALFCGDDIQWYKDMYEDDMIQFVKHKLNKKYNQKITEINSSNKITLGKPTIINRQEKFIHPIKELSNRANVTVKTVEQALDVIKYIYE